jgi:hypothetical protein
MKVSLSAQIHNAEKRLRVTIYKQENGKWFAIKVDLEKETTGGKDYVATFHDLESRAQAVALAEL